MTPLVLQARGVAARAATAIEGARIVILVVGVACVFALSVPEARAVLGLWLHGLLWTALALFALEWSQRLASALLHRKVHYLRSARFVVDSAAVLPVPAALLMGVTPEKAWLFGVLWLFKVPGALGSLALIGRVIGLERQALAGLVVQYCIVVSLAAAAMHLLEGGVQPGQFGTMPSALYWATTTVTTTGYGDIVPITMAGRIGAGITMIAGVVVLGLLIGILGSGYTAEHRRRDLAQTWDTIERSPLFRGLTPRAMLELGNLLKTWEAQRGTLIVRQGRKGDSMYFIVAGQVTVSRVEDGVEIFSLELGSGAFFGEMALLGDGLRTASVTAAAPTTLLVLSRTDFRVFLAKYPALAAQIQDAATTRTAHVAAES